MVVVLPAPFGPRKACTSPVRTVRSRPSSAVALPKRLRSPRASIAFAMRSSLSLIQKFVKVPNDILARMTAGERGQVDGRLADGQRAAGESVPEFIERFAALLITAGFPPMPARVFVALLVTDSGRLSSVE